MTEETVTAVSTATDPDTATAAVTRQRRKRKWDQPAEGVLAAAAGVVPGLLPMAAAGAFAGLGAMPNLFPYVNYFPGMSSPALPSGAAAQSSPTTVQQNAAAIVQKFNQDMASKGILLQAKMQEELIAREITINEADPGVRYKLTKRQTQEEIQVKTGAVVITRGRYRPPNGPVELEKPLYLHISAGVNLKDTAERIKAVDQAAAMVEEMLKQGQQAQQAPSRSALAGNSTNGNAPIPVTANIFVGFEADPSFNLIGRIRGPNDQYINHIMTETGATVVLRGRGSGNREGPSGEELPQPLHLAISSDSPKSVEDAKTLAENLLETIRADSFSHRVPPYQVLTVPSVPPSTYQTPPQQAPYQVSLPPRAYGGYRPPVGGVYPPYSMNQAPAPFPPSPLSPAQPTSAPAHPYSNMSPASKVYGAVPPPMQLLGNKSAEQADQATSVEKKTPVRIREKFSQSSTTDSSSSSSLTSASVSATSPAPSFSPAGHHHPVVAFGSPQMLQPHLNGGTPAHHVSANQVSQSSPQMVSAGQSFVPAYSQAFSSNQSQQPPASSSYGGYSGVYSEAAPPLPQQVAAHALQRPPLPVSVKPPTSLAFLATLTKAQSNSLQDKYAEKQPAQRRKFKEYPIAGKDASEDEQQGRRAKIRSGVDDAPALSDDPSPPGTSMPPPASRSMPPPPPKIMPSPRPVPSAVPSRATSNSSLSSSPSSGSKPHDGYGLKLVEYGEEEEESLAGSAPAPPPPQTKPFANGKPFWAA